jgi:hypothetical protein
MNKEDLIKRLSDRQPNSVTQVQRSASMIRPPQMPSMSQMARNLAQSVGRNLKSVAAGNELRLTAEEANKRLSICKGCEFFNQLQQRCGKCGCFMAVKTYLRAERCPIGKW